MLLRAFVMLSPALLVGASDHAEGLDYSPFGATFPSAIFHHRFGAGLWPKPQSELAFADAVRARHERSFGNVADPAASLVSASRQYNGAQLEGQGRRLSEMAEAFPREVSSLAKYPTEQRGNERRQASEEEALPNGRRENPSFSGARGVSEGRRVSGTTEPYTRDELVHARGGPAMFSGSQRENQGGRLSEAMEGNTRDELMHTRGGPAMLSGSQRENRGGRLSEAMEGNTRDELMHARSEPSMFSGLHRDARGGRLSEAMEGNPRDELVHASGDVPMVSGSQLESGGGRLSEATEGNPRNELMHARSEPPMFSGSHREGRGGRLSEATDAYSREGLLRTGGDPAMFSVAQDREQGDRLSEATQAVSSPTWPYLPNPYAALSGVRRAYEARRLSGASSQSAPYVGAMQPVGYSRDIGHAMGELEDAAALRHMRDELYGGRQGGAAPPSGVASSEGSQSALGGSGSRSTKGSEHLDQQEAPKTGELKASIDQKQSKPQSTPSESTSAGPSDALQSKMAEMKSIQQQVKDVEQKLQDASKKPRLAGAKGNQFTEANTASQSHASSAALGGDSSKKLDEILKNQKDMLAGLVGKFKSSADASSVSKAASSAKGAASKAGSAPAVKKSVAALPEKAAGAPRSAASDFAEKMKSTLAEAQKIQRQIGAGRVGAAPSALREHVGFDAVPGLSEVAQGIRDGAAQERDLDLRRPEFAVA